MGLGDRFIKLDRSIDLPMTIGKGKSRKAIMAEFVVLQYSPAYNVILGRKTINDFSGVMYTKFLVMKYEYEVVFLCLDHGMKCADDLSYWSLRAQMGGVGVSSDAINTTSLRITGIP
ncbi:hypothetical protein PIB30_034871 [Stylosanthes scabra]|uniref:Uncharacterized protein n=1 Tax=Stylosanthes scabra TaxID=79078 RepID=A0ABU6QCE2_9FABA|nr:hypothetical protein [Stylosanthes scabra]